MYGDVSKPEFWSVRILELEQRQRDLDKWYTEIKEAPLPHDFNTSYETWLEYRETGALPFARGWLAQPQWLLDDFHYYDLLKEYRALSSQIAEAKLSRLKTMGK